MGHTFYLIKEEEDPSGGCNIQALTKDLESLDRHPTIQMYLGRGNIEHPKNVRFKDGKRDSEPKIYKDTSERKFLK